VRGWVKEGGGGWWAERTRGPRREGREKKRKEAGEEERDGVRRVGWWCKKGGRACERWGTTRACKAEDKGLRRGRGREEREERGRGVERRGGIRLFDGGNWEADGDFAG